MATRASSHNDRRFQVETLAHKHLQRLLSDREKQIEIGTEIEKEHFTKSGKPKDKTPRAVATTHVDENPPDVDYYPTQKKPKGAGEKLTWTNEE